MNRPQLNLQDIFLNQVRKENISVTIYLMGGVQLRGMVRGFDAFTVLLDSVGKPTQLVYKHSITSIVPSRPIANFYAEAQRDHAMASNAARQTNSGPLHNPPPNPEPVEIPSE